MCQNCMRGCTMIKLYMDKTTFTRSIELIQHCYVENIAKKKKRTQPRLCCIILLQQCIHNIYYVCKIIFFFSSAQNCEHTRITCNKQHKVDLNDQLYRLVVCILYYLFSTHAIPIRYQQKKIKIISTVKYSPAPKRS